jgi:hypothetical protein
MREQLLQSDPPIAPREPSNPRSADPLAPTVERIDKAVGVVCDHG